MSFRRLPIASLLLLPLLLAAGPIEMPAEVRVPVGRLGALAITTTGSELQYIVAGGDIDAFREYDLDPKTIRLRVQAYQAGTADIVAATLVDGKISLAKCHLIFGDAPPVPPGPNPPGPNPPTPPDPPAPIPLAGLRSLIVYESADVHKLPAAQMKALYSVNLRKALTDYCIKTDKGLAEWRYWDKDAPTENEPAHWQAAMKLAHEKLSQPGFVSPLWILSNGGVGGYCGPFPQSEKEAMDLVEKYRSK